jgi:hypothetical protein
MGFLVFNGFFFGVLHPLYFGGHNFLNSNPFLTILRAPDVSIGGAQVFL